MSSIKTEPSMSLANPHPVGLNLQQKIAGIVAGLGILLLFVAFGSVNSTNTGIYLWPSLALMTIGTLWFTYASYNDLPEGIKNNGVFFRSLTNRGILGWLAGIVITGFYVLLYWFPSYLGLGADGAANTGLVAMFDPLSQLLKGQAASQWFVYGTLYTLAILILGFKFIWKYRHNRYQKIRTISVIFFQTAFAFLIPEFMQAMSLPYYDFKNMWPLNYYFFDNYSIGNYLNNGSIGMLMLLSGLGMVFIVSPILTYFYGKRWYCSWVCGCGGLAETAGDPFRQLSDKSTKAWNIERYMIHSVLVFVIVMTIAVIFSYLQNSGGKHLITKDIFVWITTAILGGLIALTLWSKNIKTKTAKSIRIAAIVVMSAILAFTWFAYISGSGSVFFIEAYKLRSWYGFLIGSAFSGVIGVGFYPILGSRVWCRFGCPMAAILGLQQKFFLSFSHHYKWRTMHFLWQLFYLL